MSQAARSAHRLRRQAAPLALGNRAWRGYGRSSRRGAPRGRAHRAARPQKAPRHRRAPRRKPDAPLVLSKLGSSFLDRSETPGKDALLRMQSVFGLIENDGLRTVDHIVGHFLAAMGRQAMHEDRVLVRTSHEFRIDLVGGEQLVAESLVNIAHRDPAIRDDRVGSLYRLIGIADELQTGARTARPIEKSGLQIEPGWGCDMKRKIEPLRGMDPAREHVVGVAAPGDRAPLDRTFHFLE